MAGRLLTESLLLARVEWHAEIDSTNTRALSYAGQAELPTPYLVGAEQQTAGRGRGGNRWWSATGALLVSVVLDPARDFGGRAGDQHSDVELAATVTGSGGGVV